MSFNSLPVELADLLADYCTPHQLSRLSRVNHAFHAIFNPILYKRNGAVTGLPSCYPWTLEHDPKYCGQCPVDKASRSCLHWAVDHDSLSTIELAVAYGSDINKINDVADYVPYEADSASIAICGPIIRVQLATPLHLAIFQKRFEIVRWLLDNGAHTDEGPDKLCNCGSYGRVGNTHRWLPLHYAIRHSTHEIFQLLLERDVIYSAISDDGKIPGLHCAIAKGSLSAIDAFIQHKSLSPNYRDAKGQTPLHWVKRCNNQDVACAMVGKLVQWGVPLDAEAKGQWRDWYGGTALTVLIRRRKFEPAVTLLQLGADPMIQQGEDGCLRLLEHCIIGRYRENIDKCSPDRAERRRETGLRLLNLLIQKGVDPGRPRNPDSQDVPRPLYSALVATRDARYMQVLLDAGGMAREAIDENHHDTLLRDFFDMVANDMAMDSSLPEMREEVESRKESVRLLLDRGARIDSRDGQYSALSKACEIEQGFGILSFLIENATCRNTEVEYVVTLRDTYMRDEPLWKKLDRFYHKLVAENGDREQTHSTNESA
ncbi:ankyrin repeat-containing domain protein [Fusarium redolens]|uniref:Ankyrin repeat-containing domain protein n=1 Tax=Fusarium redolens TaxID=48865 RepID=A0A9P9JWG3_FUSRE|nr:ankyrin repeat-containing domain protein [Fusarium redolens]KAH7240162.1 ankyrin repeat-containing domain protein [Fusarium redolens]